MLGETSAAVSSCDDVSLIRGKFDRTEKEVDCGEASGIVNVEIGLVEVLWSSSDRMSSNTCWWLGLVTGYTPETIYSWSEERFFMISKRKFRRWFLTPESWVDWRLRWDVECRISRFVRDSNWTEVHEAKRGTFFPAVTITFTFHKSNRYPWLKRITILMA